MNKDPRRLVLETNLNHKLSADTFVHVAIPPSMYIPESSLQEPIEVLVKDDPDFRAKVWLLDTQRLTLAQLRNVHSLPSHGLTAEKFREWWSLRYPNSSPDTVITVYYFSKTPGDRPANSNI